MAKSPSRASEPAPTLDPPAPKGQPAPPAPTPALRVCATCDVWDRMTGVRQGDGSYVSMEASGEWGLCRAKPPVPLTVFNEVQTIGPLRVAPAVWPSTFAGENCGEWRGEVDRA